MQTNLTIATLPSGFLGISNNMRPALADVHVGARKGQASRHNELPISRMATLLNMPQVESLNQGSAFDCEWQHHRPGDTIYTPEAPRNKAFIIMSGAVQRTRVRTDGSLFGAPGQFAFAGCHELIGLHPPGQARPESATAIFETEVLALPLDAMRRTRAIAAFFSEWVVRPLSVALMRDWQVACRFKALPSYSRVVEGLAHLTRLTMAASQGDATQSADLQHLDCHIDLLALAGWLGLSEEEAALELRKLERYGLISQKDGCIVEVEADSLAQLSAIVLRHGALTPATTGMGRQ